LLDSVEFARFNETNTETERKFFNLKDWRSRLFIAGAKLPGDFLLRAGDRIYVRAIPKWLEDQHVVVSGEVKFPGVYPIRRNKDRLADIIERAGGFTEDASLEGAVIIRREDIKEVDKEFDRLSKIPPSEMNKNELWYYRARARENKGVMAVDFRRLFDAGNTEDNIELRNQDSIFIPASKNFINVLGRANSPGRVIFRPGLTYEQYIEMAGGFGYRADENETVVVKPKGEQFLASSKKYALEPGDTIIIPEETDVSFLDVFKDTLTILSQVATVALVIITAINSSR
jgi:protein involved in polysaccharide export with SLBB domain